MLSIAKLRVGQEAYQLSGVAQSLDDYYTGAGEAAGVWVGGGAARLASPATSTPMICGRCSPGSRPGPGGLTPNGERPRPHPRRVPGFDLTFKAPKSASVLYAVSDDPRVQGAVIEAGEAAMRAALGWLEREAIRVRRGSHNRAWLAAHARRTRSSGRVSWRRRGWWRPPSGIAPRVPVTRCCIGMCWSPTWPKAPTAAGRRSSIPTCTGMPAPPARCSRAAFRDELTASLGVEWRPGRHVGEIAGIPQALLDGFSKRSTEIDAWLAATGTPDTPAGRQAAVLATRRHKPEVEAGRFDEAWKAEAEAAGSLDD